MGLVPPKFLYLLAQRGLFDAAGEQVRKRNVGRGRYFTRWAFPASALAVGASSLPPYTISKCEATRRSLADQVVLLCQAHRSRTVFGRVFYPFLNPFSPIFRPFSPSGRQESREHGQTSRRKRGKIEKNRGK